MTVILSDQKIESLRILEGSWLGKINFLRNFIFIRRVMSLQASKAKARSHTHARVAIAAARVNKCSLYMTRVH